MQHPLPKKVGCTHACVTAILSMNSPANLQGNATVIYAVHRSENQDSVNNLSQIYFQPPAYHR